MAIYVKRSERCEAAARAHLPLVGGACGPGTRPVLTGLLGFGLGVVRRDDVAVLLLDVPAVSARDDVNVRHLPSPFRSSRETIGRGNCERAHALHDVPVAVVKPPWVSHSITRSDDFDANGFR